MSHRQAYAYLASNFTITSQILNELQARIAELDTCLSDPSVTGKERKKLRRLRWRARNSVEPYQNQLHNLDRAMTYVAFQIHSAETAALESYVPPILRLPPRPAFYVSDGSQADIMSDFSSMPRSFMSAGSGWESPCAEYSDHPNPPFAWFTMPYTEPQHVDADGNFLPGEGLVPNNAAEQSTSQAVDHELLPEEAYHTTRRASTADVSEKDEECCSDTPRRHSIAEAPGFGVERGKMI